MRMTFAIDKLGAQNIKCNPKTLRWICCIIKKNGNEKRIKNRIYQQQNLILLKKCFLWMKNKKSRYARKKKPEPGHFFFSRWNPAIFVLANPTIFSCHFTENLLLKGKPSRLKRLEAKNLKKCNPKRNPPWNNVTVAILEPRLAFSLGYLLKSHKEGRYWKFKDMSFKSYLRETLWHYSYSQCESIPIRPGIRVIALLNSPPSQSLLSPSQSLLSPSQSLLYLHNENIQEKN